MLFIKVDTDNKKCEIVASGDLLDHVSELILGIRRFYDAIVKNTSDLPVEAVKDVIIASLELAIDDIKESEV